MAFVAQDGSRSIRWEMPAAHDLDTRSLWPRRLTGGMVPRRQRKAGTSPMEMHQVRYFVALCETLNFTRAAERCHVTQPSLTRAIKLLEDELGGQLFNRERDQTHLTELGRLMEPHLREVMDQARSARARATSFFALRTAKLKLGVARGVSFLVLDDTLRRFVGAYPDTEIALHDDRPADLREALRRGDFELVLLPQRAHDLDDLHYYPVGQDRLFAILPEGHALAALEAVPLAALAEEVLVCGDGCPFWEAADRSFRDLGLSVTPRAVVTRAEWLFELVSAGVGVGVAARHADLPRGLVTRPVDGAALVHEINLTTKRGRLYSPPVKAFVDIALKPRPRPAQAALAASAA
jgi:LysR family transcriptional regulator, hydrogen peroxide-inducible genes activator